MSTVVVDGCVVVSWVVVPCVVVSSVVVSCVAPGQPPGGAGMMSRPSWCARCAASAALLIVISTYGFDADPVAWQIVTFPGGDEAGGFELSATATAPPRTNPAITSGASNRYFRLMYPPSDYTILSALVP